MVGYITVWANIKERYMWLVNKWIGQNVSYKGDWVVEGIGSKNG